MYCIGFVDDGCVKEQSTATAATTTKSNPAKGEGNKMFLWRWQTMRRLFNQSIVSSAFFNTIGTAINSQSFQEIVSREKHKCECFRFVLYISYSTGLHSTVIRCLVLLHSLSSRKISIIWLYRHAFLSSCLFLIVALLTIVHIMWLACSILLFSHHKLIGLNTVYDNIPQTLSSRKAKRRCVFFYCLCKSIKSTVLRQGLSKCSDYLYSIICGCL